MAKWVCPVCGHVYQGNAAPEKCPRCVVPGSTFKQAEPGKAGYACEHVIGDGKDEARHGAGFTGLYNRYFK